MTPFLEVHPDSQFEDDWFVRVRSVNGNTLMSSRGYTQGNALRFARTFNTSVAQGRLIIRVLNERGATIRIIHPGDPLTSVGERVP